MEAGGTVPEADEAADIEEVWAWAAGLNALHARIAGRFARAEPRRRVLAYVRGLLGNVGRKNGWQLAEHAGDKEMRTSPTYRLARVQRIEKGRIVQEWFGVAGHTDDWYSEEP
jgi:hypothetical protein